MALAPKLDVEFLPRLIASAKARTRDHAIARLIVDSAARPCELASLTWRSLTDAAGNFSGRMHWQGRKGGNTRDIPLATATVEALKTWRAECEGAGVTSKYVFPGPGDGKMADSSMSDAIRQIFRRAGLDASGYSARHAVLTFKAGRCIANDLNAADLARWSGHKSSDSVVGYIEAHRDVAALDAPTSEGV
jgi:integrase